ncbi:hypothetical protein P170DRAFT_438083 [Aspergillus steynii IBT 23096]|uniref:Zn(2)-C6 fungal-type domain-containing protein n=1 Tax=Aspergillus steynii IBT 23096 TaxID=1392250 RepID=A0A2I2G6G1_9EURO|nr:uncharacterized protein P170DRAFT_438083 [Aspergillus steynii IBT 23096]PLB48458.1 hypothetical protein P170DRAFT_438083 [Aspergillus steynii IBT 23096]
MNVPSAGRNALPASPQSLPSKRLEIIRASCDNCAKSKVRCSKEQPRCQRCVYQGVNCIYSPSQRARKRPLDAFHARSRRCDTSNGPRNAVATGDTAFDADPIEHITVFKDGKASTDPDPYVFPNSNMFHTDVDSLLNWDDSVATLDEQPPSHEDASGMLESLEMPSMPRPPDLHRTLDDPDSQFSWLFRNEKDTPPLSQGLMAGAASYSPRAHHHCTELAISTIQKLDVPMASPCPSLSSPGTPTPVSMASCGSESLSFDTILQDNHAALDNLLTILHCSCAGKYDLVFLITMVCSQILCWYQASLDRSASNNCSTGSSSSISGSKGSSTHSRGPSAGTTSLRDTSPSPFERVSIPSIRIGTYTLDHEHSDRMVAQLILTELLRMKEVVEVFSRTFCYRGDYTKKYTAQGAVGEDSRSHLHQALEAFLRSRLKTAVRTAYERLNQR